MLIPTRPILRSPIHTARAIAWAALAPLLGSAPLFTSAQAATVSCQAINASSLLAPWPSLPSPACTSPVKVGDTFEVNFSNVFSSNSSDFGVSNTYSLQIANIIQRLLAAS